MPALSDWKDPRTLHRSRWPPAAPPGGRCPGQELSHRNACCHLSAVLSVTASLTLLEIPPNYSGCSFHAPEMKDCKGCSWKFNSERSAGSLARRRERTMRHHQHPGRGRLQGRRVPDARLVLEHGCRHLALPASQQSAWGAERRLTH